MARNAFFVCIFFALGFLLTVGVFLLLGHSSGKLLSPSHFSLEKAPRESLVGTITSLSGSVLWQSRSANNPILITKPQQIQQGEELETGHDGKVTLEIPQVVGMTVLEDSQVGVIQTLPANIVIQENEGNIAYEGLSTTVPISIRCLDLLVTIKKGQVSISVDKDTQEVRVSMSAGLATIAYTDTNNTTQLLTLTKGKKLVFNNNTKEVTKSHL